MRGHTLGRLLTSILVGIMLMLTVAPLTVAEAQSEPEPFSWWMEPRYELGWRVYNPDTHSYPTSYLYPDGWFVGFDACESPLADSGNVTAYRWRIDGVDFEYAFESEALANCRFDKDSDPAPPALPQQGSYSVTLTVEFSDGSTGTATQDIVVRDLLIVSIGDSNASGEGNPHVNQVGGLRPADDVWFDRRCHRSAFSGHARAAASIEAADPHTAVTFISFACSGAEIFDGLIYDYYGIELPDNALTTPLDPQLISIMEHLCVTDWMEPGCIGNPRQVDSLFMSIGINDVGFSGLLTSCMGKEELKDIRAKDLWIPGVVDVLLEWDWGTIMDNPVEYLFGPLDEYFRNMLGIVLDLFSSDAMACGEELDPIVDMNYAALWAHYGLLDTILDGETNEVVSDIAQYDGWKYRWLAPSLRTSFMKFYGGLPEEMLQSIVPAEVYINEYPDDPFRDDYGASAGCGFFEGISQADGRWMNSLGKRLNKHIGWMAESHRWYLVDGIAEDFTDHGYCHDSDSYFVSLSQSLLTQFGYHGAMHPNTNGHTVNRDRLLEAYYSAKPDWSPAYNVDVTIEAVRVLDNRTDAGSSATVTAKVHDYWYRNDNMINQLEVTKGDWVELPQAGFRYSQRIASDEIIIVLANTTLAGTHYIPPKCYPPECMGETTPSIKLGVEREYSLENGFGRDTGECEEQPGHKFYISSRVCTVSMETGDAALEVRYKITVMDLKSSPVDPDLFDDPVTCGPNCEGASDDSGSGFDRYADVLEVAGEDATVAKMVLTELSPESDESGPVIDKQVAEPDDQVVATN